MHTCATTCARPGPAPIRRWIGRSSKDLGSGGRVPPPQWRIEWSPRRPKGCPVPHPTGGRSAPTPSGAVGRAWRRLRFAPASAHGARDTRPRSGVGLGLSTAPAARAERPAHPRRGRWGDPRGHERGASSTRDQPPAWLVPAAGRRANGPARVGRRPVLLRVEGHRALLRRGRRGPAFRAGGVELPGTHRLLRCARGLSLVLPGAGRRVLRGRRARDASSRPVLWRLDHPRRGRSVQGRPRHPRLVSRTSYDSGASRWFRGC